jgi:hypothetical protein
VVLPGKQHSIGPHPLELIDHIGIDESPAQIARYRQSLKRFLKDAPTVSEGTPVLENSMLPVYISAFDAYYSEFKPEVERIGRIVKAKAQIAPFKGEDRAKEKIVKDYKGNVNQLVDVVRGSITCKTAAQAIQAYEEVQKAFGIVRVKNRFKKPAGGYRDMLINVRLGNGHIAEIQIHLEDIINIKEGAGHKLYESVRALADKIEAGTITPEEQALVNQANAEMKKMYDEAWEKAKSIRDK